MTKTRPLTEEQWLTERSPDRLLRYLQQHRRITKVPGGQRRVWLFKIGCCRLIWDRMEDERSRHVPLKFAGSKRVEGHAPADRIGRGGNLGHRSRSGGQSKMPGSERTGRPKPHPYFSQQLRGVRGSVGDVHPRHERRFIHRGHVHPFRCWRLNQPDWTPEERSPAARERAAGLVADLARCIFGNPFQPIAIDEAWIADKGSTVARLARAIYEERAFDRLAVLSDALEEAGCTDPAILKHCREEHGTTPAAVGSWTHLLGER